MILLRQYSLLGLSLFLPFSLVHAYARVIENVELGAKSESATLSRPNSRKDTTSVVTQKKYTQNYQHMVSGSVALRRLDVDDYTYGTFNGQAIENIDEKSINDISFDYSFAYHYRPAPTYSLGISFDRLQINQNSLDLRYSSSDIIDEWLLYVEE